MAARRKGEAREGECNYTPWSETAEIVITALSRNNYLCRVSAAEIVITALGRIKLFKKLSRIQEWRAATCHSEGRGGLSLSTPGSVVQIPLQTFEIM